MFFQGDFADLRAVFPAGMATQVSGRLKCQDIAKLGLRLSNPKPPHDTKSLRHHLN